MRLILSTLTLIMASTAYSAQIDYSAKRSCVVTNLKVENFQSQISIDDTVSTSSGEARPLSLTEIVTFNKKHKAVRALFSMYLRNATTGKTSLLVAYSNLAFSGEDATSLSFSTPKDVILPPGFPNEGSRLRIAMVNGNDNAVTMVLDENHLSGHRNIELTCTK